MSLRVLLADESASIKKVFQLGLQDFAAKVKSVQSGVDVIEVAESFQPDIIFADILLQKRNGYDVCIDIKQHPTLSKIPFVLMWSSFMELDQSKYLESGAEGEIEKPFDVDAMRNQIQQLVPSLGEQNLASFLKFPTSIAEEFVEEEKQRQPQAPEPPIPSSPQPQGLGVSEIPPAHLPPTNNPVVPPEAPMGFSAPPEPMETVDSTVEDSSIFNFPEEDAFEMESIEPLQAMPRQGVTEIEPTGTPGDDSQSFDITQWRVDPPAPPSSILPSESATGIAPPGEEPKSVSPTEDMNLHEPDEWQSANLSLTPEVPDLEDSLEDAIDGFESVSMDTHKSADPIELDSFLYKPGDDDTPLAEEPPVENVIVRSVDGDEFQGETSVASGVMEADIVKLVAEQVTQQLSSDGIEALVRAHAQEVIKLNIIDQLPMIIEKIAREELDKLLKEEIAEGTKVGPQT